VRRRHKDHTCLYLASSERSVLEEFSVVAAHSLNTGGKGTQKQVGTLKEHLKVRVDFTAL